MRARELALAGACWAALALSGCGKAPDAAGSDSRPSDDEVRAALKAHYFANAPKGVVQKNPPDFSAFKVGGCSKSAREGFECDIVNPAGVAIKDRFVKGAQGWEAAERVGG